MLVILCGSYAWFRWGAGQWGFSPLILLGQASLLVYWVHIEFVYGRFSILPKRGVDVRTASLGLMIIFLAMLALAWARTRMKGRGAQAFAWLRPRLGERQLNGSGLLKSSQELHDLVFRPAAVVGAIAVTFAAVSPRKAQ